MKKTVSLLLVVIMLLTFFPPAFAADFDYENVLGAYNGYEYDKFSQTWSYHQSYVEEFGDGDAVIILNTMSDKSSNNPLLLSLNVKVWREKGTIIQTVESISFLIDGVLYSYDSLVPLETESFVVLGEQGQQLIRALADCDPANVAVKIGTERGDLPFDLNPTKFTNTLKEFCKVYIDNNLWDYTEDKQLAAQYEELYPLTIDSSSVAQLPGKNADTVNDTEKPEETANDDGFHEDVLKNSNLYIYDSATNSWKVVGRYSKSYTDAEVSIVVFLCSDYVANGWGPDLRIRSYDKEHNCYDKIDYLNAIVDDKIYSFENFDQEDNDDSGVVFGGEVMRAFLNALPNAKMVTFVIGYTTQAGEAYYITIDSVKHSDLKELIDINILFEISGLWNPSVTTDQKLNDEYHKASVRENESYDESLYKSDPLPDSGYLVNDNGFSRTIGEFKNSMQTMLSNNSSGFISDYDLQFDMNPNQLGVMQIKYGTSHVVYSVYKTGANSDSFTENDTFEALFIQSSLHTTEEHFAFYEQLQALTYLLDSSVTTPYSTMGILDSIMNLKEGESVKVGPMIVAMFEDDPDRMCLLISDK